MRNILPTATAAVHRQRHTAFYVKDVYYELTLYMDLWNNEIVSYALSSIQARRPYDIHQRIERPALDPRAGTPTDNAAMEAINGWIKAEMFMDFHVTGEMPAEKEVDEYITFFNKQRLAYALSYLTPKQYKESYLEKLHV